MIARIAEALKAHQRFVVMSHLRPDGDAIGCTLALGLALRQLGKDVTFWNHDGLPEKFHFLPGAEHLTTPPKGEKHDFEVAIAVDTAVQNRIGDCANALGQIGLWINIDHHISNNGYGDLALIDADAPAAGQIVYELLTQGGLPLDAAIAENLFAAISTDTGSFQYSNTTARTLEIAAALVHTGVQVGPLSERLYQTYPLRRLELLRSMLNVLQLDEEGRVASFTLTLEEAARLGATPEDNEGLIDHIRAIEGVLVAIFFEELPGGSVRISMRSKDPRYDVCKICALFGGGGHTLAAGARLTDGLEAAQTKVLDAIRNAIHHA